MIITYILRYRIKKLNQIRYEKYLFFKKKGYSFDNVVYNSNCSGREMKIGENIVILDSFLQPHTKVGNNTFIWAGLYWVTIAQ